MRIISGKFKNRTIFSPGAGEKMRPTTDRARETIFNILENRIDFTETICIDLYCGSGSLGIEALSRGSRECFFVDTDLALIKRNVKKLELTGYSKLRRTDSLRFFNKLESPESNSIFYLIFADPPYFYKDYDKLVIAALKTDCILILEHTENYKPDKNSKHFLLHRKSGITEFTIYNFRKEKNIL